jgi:hypothetical protein
MSSTKVVVLSASLFLAGLPAFPQIAEPAKPVNNEAAQTVPLTVAAGVPLRVYLTQRLTKRLGDTVHARLLEPVFAFDREVIPANTDVIGQVAKIEPVSKMRRATAIAGGDFTPLHDAEVEFTTLIFPDGRRISMQTAQTLGLSSIYNPRTASRKKQAGTATAGSHPGTIATAKQQVKDRARAKMDSVTDVVRAPDKMERLENFLVAKLPYHPQWIRRGTRFDAELLVPLQFGSAQVPAASLGLLGSQPPPDSIAHVRLITPVNSNDAEVGDKMEAIVSQPLFSADHQLILPEGTHLTGAVTVAHPARWFRRGGQLRFSFREVELPAGLLRTNAWLQTRPLTTLATLNAVEQASKTPLKVDDEGGVTAPAPKTRFIAPAISVLIATRSIGDDADRVKLEGGGGNTGGRTLGGASGFGVLGMIAAQTSPTFAGIMGFYGMGWSVFNNIVARGSEVEFGKNAAMDIRFGARPPAPGSKFKHAEAGPAGGQF